MAINLLTNPDVSAGGRVKIGPCCCNKIVKLETKEKMLHLEEGDFI